MKNERPSMLVTSTTTWPKASTVARLGREDEVPAIPLDIEARVDEDEIVHGTPFQADILLYSSTCFLTGKKAGARSPAKLHRTPRASIAGRVIG